MFFLLDAVRLIYHEAWIFLLFILFALLFRASARANPSDGLQRYIAFWFAALALDRILAVGVVVLWLYQPWALDAWIVVIHLGLFVLELSVYLTAFYLLNQPIRLKLRGLFKGWLDD